MSHMTGLKKCYGTTAIKKLIIQCHFIRILVIKAKYLIRDTV